MPADPELTNDPALCEHPLVHPMRVGDDPEVIALGVCIACDSIIERMKMADYLPVSAGPGAWISVAALRKLGVIPDQIRLAVGILLRAEARKKKR